MMVAYVDTSALVSIAFGEPGAAEVARRLAEFTRLVSSNLLEAELRATFARENLAFDDAVVASIEWIFPPESLAAQFAAVLDAGYLRGADLWHVATALYATPSAESLYFATLDARQGGVAEALGFPMAWSAALR